MKIKDSNKRLKRLISLLIIVCGFFASVNGPKTLAYSQRQKSAPVQSQNDDLAIACEKALIELTSLRKVKALNEEEKQALNDKIAALESLVATHKAIAEAWKNADLERTKANEADAKRLAILEGVIADFKTERERLLKERDSARARGKLYFVAGLVLGILAGVYVKGRN